MENYNFSDEGKPRRNYPKHTDIIEDLFIKKEMQPVLYNSLFNVIEQVYHCHEADLDSLRDIVFDTGFSAEMIVKTLKWLFIEQDIRYWNYSGRDMLWSGIPRP